SSATARRDPEMAVRILSTLRRSTPSSPRSSTTRLRPSRPRIDKMAGFNFIHAQTSVARPSRTLPPWEQPRCCLRNATILQCLVAGSNLGSPSRGRKRMTFGERLRQLRTEKGLTLRQMALKVGVGFTYLSRVETGRMTYGDYPSEELIG